MSLASVKTKVVGIDIDDTLAISAPMVISHSNAKWHTSLTVDDYHEDWAKMWGVDYAEVARRADEYFGSGIILDYSPMPLADTVLMSLKSNFKLISVTARNDITKNDTYLWIKNNYNNVFSRKDIFFTGAWNKIDEHSVGHTKGQICKELGVDILIDDQLKHCLSAAELGITALLFGEYNWNKADILPPNVIRVRNWSEVLQYFNENR